MPIYEYQCRQCNEVTESLQKMNDDPLTECESCGGELKRLISAPAVQFKGSGWYVTDYAGKKGGDGKNSGDSKGEGAKGEGSKGEGPKGGKDSAKSDSSGSGSSSKPKGSDSSSSSKGSSAGDKKSA